MNPITALTRLLRRGTKSPVATQLFSHAIGQPLMVHPVIGEQLIGAYLHGAIDARPPTLSIGDLVPESKDPMGVVTPARRVAVLNVSGGLVNRFEPGECDPGPLSYEMLRKAFDMAMADPTVEAIVHRLESPGGMGSGLFDYTDHVFASRGKKPIYAAIDDYAYSAAFAIAAACDEIWITRTGGAGSVGVIAYHYDQSAWDAKVGLKVNAIYAGAHKNDFSPHAPMSDEMRTWLQSRMDTMRTMFAQSVADYRDMDFAAVVATEAQVYQGVEAIAVGFADKLGTYSDLMAHLVAGDTATPDAPGAPDAPAQSESMTVNADALAALSSALEIPGTVELALTPEDRAKMDRAEVADAVMAAGLSPSLAMALLSPAAAVTPSTAAARIVHAKALADLCAAAGLPDVAADYATKNTDIETARAQLQAVRAEDGPELSTSHPPANATSTKSPPLSGSAGVSGNSIRSRHRNAAAGPGLKLRQ